MQTQTAMRDFLAAVIPASGVKFLATLGNGKWVHRAHADLSEMASAAELSSRGVDVYHACASFELPEYTSAKGKKRSRTAANAVATRCFWLDIDVGDDKSYRDQRAAISALSDFCNVHGLPKPMLVSSASTNSPEASFSRHS